VSGYGENGTGDANDVWRVEIDGGKEGDIAKTVLSRLARQTTPVTFGSKSLLEKVFFCEKAPPPEGGYRLISSGCQNKKMGRD
jgi:hypothetical protein